MQRRAVKLVLAQCTNPRHREQTSIPSDGDRVIPWGSSYQTHTCAHARAHTHTQRGGERERERLARGACSALCATARTHLGVGQQHGTLGTLRRRRVARRGS